MMRPRFLFILKLGFLNCDIIIKMIIGSRVGIITNLEIEVIMDLALYFFK
jgi:hypothetical protein